LHARFYRWIVLKTIYGRLRFDVMDVEPGSGILVTIEAKTVAAGTKVKGSGAIKEPHAIPTGSVFVRRASQFGPPTWAVYEAGVYSARRGILHALAGYDESRIGGAGGEMRENLKDAAALAAAETFLSAWRALGDHEKVAVSDALLAFVGKHEDDLDADKAFAVDAVASVVDLRDSVGRPNPLIARGQLSVAQKKLLARVGAIKGIDPRLALRYAVLDREIDLEVGVIRKVKGTLAKLLAYLGHDAIGPEVLERKLRACRNSLGLLKVAPFAKPGLSCSIELNSALALVDPTETLRVTEATLARLAVSHFLHEIVERLGVMPSRSEEVEVRVAEAKRLVKAFRARNPAFFPKLAEGSAPDEWRSHFRTGAIALSRCAVGDAKACFERSVETLVG